MYGMGTAPLLSPDAAEVAFRTFVHPVIVADSKGDIKRLNEQAEQLFKVKDGYQGVHWPNVMTTLDVKKDIDLAPLDLIKEVAASGQTKTVVYQFVDLNNESRSFEINFVPVGRAAKQIIITLHDNSLELKIEEARSDFVALTSHQLRTPLSASKWFMDVFLGRYGKNMDEDQLRILQNVAKSTDRMISLVDALLNVTRIESDKFDVFPQSVNIQEIINDVIEELGTEIKQKNIKLVRSVHQYLGPIMIDRTLIRYLFANLLSNAIKYSYFGGEVVIFLSHKADVVLVQISDKGCGIPKSEFPKVFRRFFRATNASQMSGDGTGLGLYLAKVIVESSGGEIWFESNEGKGTTFWFTLPVQGKVKNLRPESLV